MQVSAKSKNKLICELMDYATNFFFEVTECELDEIDAKYLEEELDKYFHYELMNNGEQIVKTFLNKLA